MNEMITRIESIELYNFKNVGYGKINIKNNKNSSADVLGIYGQNGSGKTALINALSVLKSALRGAKLNSECADYISSGKDKADLKFTFSVSDKSDVIYSVRYEFSLGKEEDEQETTLESTVSTQHKMRAVIFDEVISYSYKDSETSRRFAPVIDTRNTDVFEPKTKYDVLVGKSDTVRSKLFGVKQVCHATSRSFVFSKELLQIINLNCKEVWHINLLNRLNVYGHQELFVIGAKASAMTSFDALPLSFKYGEGGNLYYGTLACSLSGSFPVPSTFYNMFERVIDSINTVLPKLIPDLTIEIINFGKGLLPDGSEYENVELVSLRKDKKIPLKYESEGIKKLISILQLLIFVYNREAITVVVDELDSGIFEYLLGEIVKIITEKGKGQLIFTSHNLRPLELIDSDFIAFTTINPQNRYVRLNGVKKNNNLRDVYYRNIVLGGLIDPIYDETDDAEIAFAFRKAGMTSEI